MALFSVVSIVGGVPADSENALTILSVQGFNWVLNPFVKVLIYKNTPHFTAIQYNWSDYRMKCFEPDSKRYIYV